MFTKFAIRRKRCIQVFLIYLAGKLEGIYADPLNLFEWFLGQENFIEEIKHLTRGKERLKEITGEQRYLTKPALNEIFKGKDKKSKDQVMYEAHLQYGYTLKDIAEYHDFFST